MAKRTLLTEAQEADIIELYLANMPIAKIAQQFAIGIRRVKEILSSNAIALRTKQEIVDLQQANRTQTFIQKYGVENPFQVEAFKDKIKQTNLDRYGHTCSFQNTKVREKYRQACLEKYGVEHPAQLADVATKQKQTCLKLYGVENVSQATSVRAKVRATCIEKYGVENVTQAQQIKDKISQTNKAKYGVKSVLCLPEIHERAQQSILNKYGVTSTLAVLEVQEKIKQNNIEKYGVDNIAKLETTKEKSYFTKKKNSTFNSSAVEERFYEALLSYFSSDDVVRQYKDSRYPYYCDFYIKSLDLFIELNMTWSHGPHRFNINNNEDLSLLGCWQEKAKTSNYYKKAIDTWTRRDVLKFKCAVENNLNYYAFYNEPAALNFLKTEEFKKVMENAKNS